MLDVGAYELVCHGRSSQTFQVDREKSYFGADVDKAKTLIEFDAVDNLHLSRFKINMLGAKVPVAIADPAFLHALGKPGSTAGSESGHRLLDVHIGLFGQGMADIVRRLSKILLPVNPNPLQGAVGLGGRGQGMIGVED